MLAARAVKDALAGIGVDNVRILSLLQEQLRMINLFLILTLIIYCYLSF